MVKFVTSHGIFNESFSIYSKDEIISPKKGRNNKQTIEGIPTHKDQLVVHTFYTYIHTYTLKLDSEIQDCVNWYILLCLQEVLWFKGHGHLQQGDS